MKYEIENDQSDKEAIIAQLDQAAQMPGYKNLLKEYAMTQLLKISTKLAESTTEHERAELCKKAYLWNQGPFLLENIAKELKDELAKETQSGLSEYKARKLQELEERKSGINNL